MHLVRSDVVHSSGQHDFDITLTKDALLNGRFDLDRVCSGVQDALENSRVPLNELVETLARLARREDAVIEWRPANKPTSAPEPVHCRNNGLDLPLLLLLLRRIGLPEEADVILSIATFTAL